MSFYYSFSDLALYCGAALIEPEFLPHWFEEGRGALVRRGTEFYRGKRPSPKNSSFTPFFSRIPARDEQNDNCMVAGTSMQQDNFTHDNFMNESFDEFFTNNESQPIFLEDDVEESDAGNGSRRRYNDSDEESEL